MNALKILKLHLLNSTLFEKQCQILAIPSELFYIMRLFNAVKKMLPEEYRIMTKYKVLS